MFSIEALNTNVLIWGSFMSTTTKAAVHHGQNYTDILELYRNTKLRRAEFTRYHAEIDIGPSSRNSECTYDLHGKPPSRTRSTLTHDQVIKCQSTRLPSDAWGRCKSIQKRIEDGKINSKNFDTRILAENC